MAWGLEELRSICSRIAVDVVKNRWFILGNTLHLIIPL